MPVKLNGYTDWHSHILPGVDDGVRTMKEAIGILQTYERLGFDTIWLTPHVMEDMPNATAALRERFEELKAAYGGKVRLQLASENMLDNLFEQRLECGDLLPLGEAGDSLLVETSYYSPPMDLHNTLRRIQERGYYPVLAHPERYRYMEKKDYRELKDMGVKFQLNLASLYGLYGAHVQAKALYLKRKGLYEYTGTDTHDRNMADYIGG